MPPQTAFLADSVINEIARQHADPCYSRSKNIFFEPMYNKPSKSVSFNEVVKAKKTIHVANFSAAEVKSCWYTDEDFEMMKRAVRFEVNLLENDCLEEKDNMRRSMRGLRMFTTAGGKFRRESKRRARNAVLKEQELQRKEGSNDPEYIAEIYAVATNRACKVALEAAR